MVGAGSVVTRDVPPYGLVLGNPARLRGFVCPCGYRLEEKGGSGRGGSGRGGSGDPPLPQGQDQQGQPIVIAKCTKCGMEVKISAEDWEKMY